MYKISAPFDPLPMSGRLEAGIQRCVISSRAQSERVGLFHKVREVADVKKKGYDMTVSKLFFFRRFEKDDVDRTIAYAHKLESQTVTLQMYNNKVKDRQHGGASHQQPALRVLLHLRRFSSASPAASLPQSKKHTREAQWGY